MPKDTVWNLEPHTQAKHAILRRYLGAWFAIMGKGNRRILYLDGFAGPGVYDDGALGSPVIALDTLLGHSALSPDVTYDFLFSESDPARFASLRAIVQTKTRPANVTVRMEQGKFEDVAARILVEREVRRTKLAPTFAFLDPFGAGGMPIHLVARLLGDPKCELFCYFDLNSLIRFGTAGGVTDSVMERLLGTDEFKQAPPTGRAREDFYVDLFERQLKTVGGFTHTVSFVMKGRTNKPICAMVYATRSLVGLDKMKEAMWKVDPSGGFTFCDRTGNDLLLFTEEPDIPALASRVHGEFTARPEVPVEIIENFVIAETPFCKKHTRRALTFLEDAGRVSVSVRSDTKRRRGTFPSGKTHLTFS